MPHESEGTALRVPGRADTGKKPECRGQPESYLATMALCPTLLDSAEAWGGV